MNILITGGTGFLGRHLATALLHQGHTVRLLGRNFAATGPLLALGAQPVIADLADERAVVAACTGMDAVCHVGALSAPWGRRADFEAANVRGTAHVLAGCRRARVGRLVHISSPAVVFTGGDHRDTTENAPFPRRFTSIYAETKKQAEDLVNTTSDVPAVILRPKAIFGPGDTSLIPRLLAAARAGRLPQIGDGRNLVDLTYVENVVHAIGLSLHAPAAVGKTYFITNDEHVPLWAVIRTLLGHLGLLTRLRQVPLPLAMAAAAAMEAQAAVSGKEPLLTRYSVAILARTQTYDISAAKRDLGYQPLLSVAEGVERTLERLKTEG